MTTATLDGVDLSRFQTVAFGGAYADPDFIAMSQAGISFAIIQADEAFAETAARCSDSPVIGAAYGFLDMMGDPVRQVETWGERIVRAKFPGVLFLDLEHAPASVPIPARLEKMRAAAQACFDVLGNGPGVYSFRYYDNREWPDDFGAFPFWLSAPMSVDVVPDPYPKLDVPSPWQKAALHQWTDDLHVVRTCKGYPGHALRDRFFGSLDDFRMMLGL